LAAPRPSTIAFQDGTGAWTPLQAGRYNALLELWSGSGKGFASIAMSSCPELSIIIPALNEERRLPETLEKIHMYVTSKGICAEVLVVDDGSTDGTARVVDAASARFPEVRRISNPTNHGKGFAVRQGMLAACGEIVLFSDADLSTPIEEADKLIAALRQGEYDGAIGSRNLDRRLIESHQSVMREAGGMVFNRVVRLLTGLPFADTQCGFKAFRRDRARILFEQQRIIGFGFDPEILFLAGRHGLRIAEIPVRWAHDPGSKVKFLSDGLHMVGELWTIRRNAWRGHYPRREDSAPGTSG
jgi:glycosyltransferase involved in cell wall biosynthesis